VHCKRSCSFTDIPLDGVQAVAAIGDVSDTEVLGTGQKIFDTLR
jgi:hypothetical protein